MAHDSNHYHDHSHAADINDSNKKAFIIGIVLNLGFVLAEVVAGIATNSVALLTDAGHNASDVAGLVLSLVSLWMAKKKSSAIYTYGFKKTTVLASFANAVFFLIAVGMLGYESVLRLLKPQNVQANTIAWVAALGIIINSVSAFLFYQGQKKELNAKSAYLHLLMDALISVGVVIGGIVMSYTHWYWLDPAIGLVIMVIIVAGTWGLLKDSFKMTIDAVPAGIDLAEIKNSMLTIEGVTKVEHVHVWPLSTMENALTAHITVTDTLSFPEKLQVISNVKHELMHNNIQHSTLEMGL